MDAPGTVASTIDLVNKIVTYIQAVKGAKEDRLELLSEVSALGSLLEILRERLDNTHGYDDNVSRLLKAGIKGPLQQCYEDLQSTAKELERIASPANAGTSSSVLESMKNVRWPFQQENIRAMLGRTERLKSLVLLALQTSLMEFVEETHDDLENLGMNVKEVGNAISALEAAQKAHMEETVSLRVNLHDLIVESQDSVDGIARIDDKIAIIGRNQQGKMIKGDRMQADLAIIKESVYNRELQDLVKWLSPLDFGERHNTVFEQHARDTGEWFLKDPKFLAWRGGDPGYKTLWCPGHPGVGKSVMVSLIINELGKAIPEDTALVFVYFEYKTKYTMSQLFEVILKQLVRRRITQSSLELLRKHKAGNRPTSGELFDMLKVEMGTYGRVLVVIDALDEVDIQIWAPLLEHLQGLHGIRLFATSRDTGEIELGLRPYGYQRLDIMANEGDMKKYIEGRLESSPAFKHLLAGRADVHEEVTTGILKKADGMFLLAQLHMNSLETKLSVEDLRQALVKLPKDLDATYDKAMSRIHNKNRVLAYRVISWLIHAARPMTIHDLQYALAVEGGMTTFDRDNLYDELLLTSICVGLVILQEDTAGSKVANPHTSKVVGFVHYTAQEYFLHNPRVSAQFPDCANFAVICLRYLAFDIFKPDGPFDENTWEQLLETPFATYAMLSWGVHARMHWGDEGVRGLATELLRDSQRVVVVGSLPCHAKSLSAIHLCVRFGLKDYLESLLDDGCDINLKDSNGDTVVSYAALFGQEDIMRLLLAREGVNVNPKGRNGTTPLARAIRRGYEAIVQLILARDDLDVNPRDKAGNTPIIDAARGGHSGIMKLLLARDGVDVNSQGRHGYTPLSIAVYRGHEAIVRLLMVRDDLDANLRDDVGNTPIIDAARGGHSGIAELLLARGDLDVNSQGQDGYTPLSVAAYNGHETIVRLLLARDGLDVNLRDDVGNPPIIDAVQGGHSGIVKLLLARGDLDVNLQGRYGYTSLSIAAYRGHGAIVRLLLARDDLAVNLRDKAGNTPIIDAVQGGHSGIVELLLARDGLDVNSQGWHGYTPLSVAAYHGHETIARLLLARDDLDVNLRDNGGDTPIIGAVRGGHGSIVEMLLARDDVDINSQGRYGRTPLLAAVEKGNEAIIQLLLARADLDTSWRSGKSSTLLKRFAGP